MYHSEEVRRLAPEMDPLRLGMGWKLEDLEKPKVIIESTFGDSHPGSAHLLNLIQRLQVWQPQAAGPRAISQRISATAWHRAMTVSIILWPAAT
ncbi:MAG: hypothetical protein ACLR7U_07655 [Ruthenibacterium lactatiformans]